MTYLVRVQFGLVPVKKANLIRAIREGEREMEEGNEARDRRARISRKGTEREEKEKPLLLSHFRPRKCRLK